VPAHQHRQAHAIVRPALQVRQGHAGQTHVAPCKFCSAPGPLKARTSRVMSCINIGRLGCAKLMPGAGTRWRLMSGGLCLWYG
jgi:hypothetical protein